MRRVVVMARLGGSDVAGVAEAEESGVVDDSHSSESSTVEAHHLRDRRAPCPAIMAPLPAPRFAGLTTPSSPQVWDLS